MTKTKDSNKMQHFLGFEMQQQILMKFFSSHGTNSFKRQITIFTQKPGETFYQYSDRY
jgi:hypothetical protein